MRAIPEMKEKVIGLSGLKKTLEIEYEQLLLRANNQEEKINTDFFGIDRQYVDKKNRFDITGIFWEKTSRRKKRYKSL